MSKASPPVVAAIIGPTASGKSALALELAKAAGGEIISCDSMQIYTHMDIGTAKPTLSERQEVRHHLIDIISPATEFSCVDYRMHADSAVADVISRGMLPIFCGGTGLYLDSALKSGGFAPDVDPSVRESLAALPKEELYRRLCECDPASAESIHPNNVRRVIRALELYIGTGITKTEWDARAANTELRYNTIKIGLDFRDRNLLYGRIDRRVDEMLASGLADEVKNLPQPLCKTACQAIGYSEFFRYGYDDISYVSEMIKQDTRNYAKRQLTWFRRDPEINWLYADETDFKEIVNISLKLITSAR